MIVLMWSVCKENCIDLFITRFDKKKKIRVYKLKPFMERIGRLVLRW